MRTIKVLILLLVLCSFDLYPQIAVVSGLRLGSQDSDKMIQQLFDSINRKYINAVVFLGDITNSGDEQDFTVFSSYLEKNLTPDDYIIPGMRDIQNNPEGYYICKDQFDGTRVRWDSSAFLMAGLSNYSPQGSLIRFYKPDLIWLDSLISTVPKERPVLFFSPAPLSKTENWYNVFNLLASRTSRFLFSAGKENTFKEFLGTNDICFGPSIENTSWNYNVIRIEQDSLYLYNYKNDTTVVRWGSFPLLNGKVSTPVDTSVISNKDSDILWKVETGKSLTSPVLVTDDRIYYASLNGEVACLDMSGKILWKHNIERTVTTTPVRDKDLLIVPTVEGDLFSLNANNGNVVEVIGTGEPLITDPLLVNVENLDGKFKGVVVGMPSGRMLCYDIYSFEPIWDNNEAKGRITSMKALDGKIYAAWGSYLYSFDLNNGTLIWKWNAGRNVTIKSFEADSKYLVLSTSNKMVFGLDILLGSTIWKKSEGIAAVSFKFADSTDQLIIKTTKDELLLLQSSTGNIINKILCPYPTDNEYGNIYNDGNDIIFSSGDGKIRKASQQKGCSELFFLGGGYLNTFKPLSSGNYLIANDQGYIISVSLKKQ